MKRVWRFISRLHDLLASHRSERDFNQEVELHLSLLIEKFIRDGMSPEDARDAARRQFGNVTSLSEIHRDMRSFGGVQAFFRDLRHGARVLRKTPAWPAVAVLTLTLGIGANIAIFSVIQAVLLKPPPYPDPARLVFVWERLPHLSDPMSGRIQVARRNYMEWKRQNTVFSDMAAFREMSLSETGLDHPRHVSTGFASANLFPMLGVNAMKLLGIKA